MKINEIAQFIINHQKFVFDSGVILAYIQNENEKITQLMDEVIFSEESKKTVLCTQLSLTEIFYIHCRIHGMENASSLIEDMKSMFDVLTVNSLHLIAGKLKCKYPIALSDCFSIASGIVKNVPVVFMQEKEFTKKIQNEIEQDFHVNLVIIDAL